VISRNEEDFEVLLIQRKNEPFKNMWALPGGFVDMEETLEHAVNRELEEETGLKDIDLKQFHTAGNPGRDPRGRNITVVFYGFTDNKKVKAGDDAENARWFSVSQLPELGFDHKEIISMFLDDIKGL
jgi:8-oxo-dGTP diphosphatase